MHFQKTAPFNSGTDVITTSYRLGPFGFLASSALKDAGFKPNNGLDDQKLGLRWVQKNISGFGGDAANVTLLCSSAGAGRSSMKCAIRTCEDSPAHIAVSIRLLPSSVS